MAWEQVVMGGDWALFIEDTTGAVKIIGSGLTYPIAIPRDDAERLALAVLYWEPAGKAFDQGAYDQKPLKLA
jgi:hypothetical protein